MPCALAHHAFSDHGQGFQDERHAFFGVGRFGDDGIVPVSFLGQCPEAVPSFAQLPSAGLAVAVGSEGAFVHVEVFEGLLLVATSAGAGSFFSVLFHHDFVLLRINTIRFPCGIPRERYL